MPATTPTPHWLDADEMRAWVTYIDFSTLLGDYLNRQLKRDSGVTHADYTLLSRLSAAPDHAMGMSALAQHLKITRSRLTRAVSRLHDMGYVIRREDPTDGRGQRAVLTDQGMELLERAAPGHVEAVRQVIFDALTTEQVKQLSEIGQVIYRALQHADGVSSVDLPWLRR